MIGKRYRGWDGKIYLCESHDRCGFWMQDCADPTNRRNVSERAIGRTFHLVPEVLPGPRVQET